MTDIKYCSGCKDDLLVEDFHKNAAQKDGLNHWCKECVKGYWKGRQRNNPITVYALSLKKLYGITVKDYERMLAEQDGLCAICLTTPDQQKRRKYLCVDHDHETGEVRGLLCGPCNSAIGLLKDNPLMLQSALNYLQKRGIRKPQQGRAPAVEGEQ